MRRVFQVLFMVMAFLLITAPVYAQGAAAGSSNWGVPIGAGIGMAIASGLCGLGQGKATAGAAPLRFGLARGSRRARFRRRAAAPSVGPQEERMISVYGTTFAHVSEIARGMIVRRLAGFHVVVDTKAIEDSGTRLWLSDGSTITLGPEGLVEVAR